MLHIATVLSFLLLTLTLVRAQDSVQSVQSPATIRGGEDYDVSFQLKYAAENRNLVSANFDLLAGESGQGANVVDIILLNGPIGDAVYHFPTSLPAGPYYVRMNATTNTTLGASAPETFSANSPTIAVTAASFTCASPSPFPNVTTINDKGYTSLIFVSPQPGDVETIDNISTDDGSFVISWAFRNNLNQFGAGIDKMQLQLLDSSGNAAITITAVDPTAGSTLMKFAGSNVAEGVYFLQASYTNTFQDGTIAPGGNVTYTSQQLFLEDSTDKCPTSSSSSGSTTSAGSSASGSGSPTGAASPSSPSSGDAHGGSSGGGSSNPLNGSALSSYSPKLGHFLLGALLYFFL